MRHDSLRALAITVLPVLLLAAGCGGSTGKGNVKQTPATMLSGIGDSIMQGADVVIFGDNPAYSFAQGTDPGVNSIYSRYLALGLPINAKEFASKSGAQMVNDALTQAQAICAMALKPDRIVIELGGNDVCGRSSVAALYPVATYQGALKSALDTLAAPACGLRTGSWVHVLSMPRVDQLQAAGLAKDAANGNHYCRDTAWPFSGFCKIVTTAPDQATLTQIGQRIDEYNVALAQEVAAADAANGGLAGIHFTTDWKGPISSNPGTSVGTYTFGAADISDLDCFHPSATGQKRLACIAWETWEHGTGNVAACVR